MFKHVFCITLDYQKWGGHIYIVNKRCACMCSYSLLLFTNATVARATVDSVRIHVRCVSHTTPMFKVNHS